MILSFSRFILIKVVNVSAEYWKVILGLSILIAVLSLISLPTLYKDLSGDGIQNNSPKGSLIEYQWDIAISRIVIAVISLAVSIYSYNKIRTL